MIANPMAQTIKPPDYAGLIAVLQTLRQLVDATGVVTLESKEAGRIEALGFQAEPGPWRVPSLPAHLVAGDPLLEPLGDDVDPFWRPSAPPAPAQSPAPLTTATPGDQTTGKADAPPSPESETPVPDRALEKECQAILTAVERSGRRIARRVLQKKLWRFRAEAFNEAIRLLITKGLLNVDGNALSRPSGEGS